MDDIKEKRLKERLDTLINKYKNYVEELENLEWKLVRLRKEITEVCNKLDYNLEIVNNENNEE